MGQIPLGVSSSTTCFLELKSGYEEHQGSFEEEVTKGQATAWGQECCCVLLGGGERSSLASLTLLMAYQVIKEGLTSSTPPAFLAPHSAWEPVGTSQTQARRWANPPHPKVDDHTSDSHYFPHPINKAQFFFSLSLSLFPSSHHPLSKLPGPLCSMRVFGM